MTKIRCARVPVTILHVCFLFPYLLAAQSQILPPLDLTETDQLSTRLSVHVTQFQFEGNTVFSDTDLAAIVADYTDRTLTSDDLEEVRQQLTLKYIDNGYINSGAVLPDQNVADGVIIYRIVEGRLTEIHVRGNQRLRSRYIQKRVRRGTGPPVNINTLQEKLQVLRLNPNIKRINAELKPGVAPGESYLDLLVSEETPFRLSLELNNHRTPSVGGERLLLRASHNNVLGFSDRIGLAYGVTKDDLDQFNLAGRDDIDVSYTFPVTGYDTELTLSYRRSDFSIIEEPFADLDIESESEDIRIRLRHPLYKTFSEELSVSLTGELRQSKSFLLGVPFSFSPGTDDGRSRVSILRFSQDWVKRSLSSVFAAHSSFNFGIDALHSTNGQNTSRDGEFFSWLGQVQYVRRLGETANQLILKASTQLSDDKLLSLEQFSIGGNQTVRGYRENQLVRDTGVLASIEFRVPLISDERGREVVQIAPFFDYGQVSNNASTAESFDDISSIGIGVLFSPGRRFNCQVYWGYPFRDANNDDDDLQDEGFHFSMVFNAF